QTQFPRSTRPCARIPRSCCPSAMNQSGALEWKSGSYRNPGGERTGLLSPNRQLSSPHEGLGRGHRSTPRSPAVAGAMNRERSRCASIGCGTRSGEGSTARVAPRPGSRPFRPPPEPPRSEAEPEGQEGKHDRTDVRASATRTRQREEMTHDQEAHRVEDEKRAPKRRERGETKEYQTHAALVYWQLKVLCSTKYNKRRVDDHGTLRSRGISPGLSHACHSH